MVTFFILIFCSLISPFISGRNTTEGILECFSASQNPSVFHSIKASDYAARLQYEKPTLVKRQGSIVSRRQDKESLGLEFSMVEGRVTANSE